MSFIVYALLIYELLGCWAGHGLMAGPLFGVAPCPTTIFTIGMLLLARGGWVVWLSIIPLLWSLVGLAAALQLGIPEDFGLPRASIHDLRGGDRAENAGIIRGVLAGLAAPRRDIVLMNASAH